MKRTKKEAKKLVKTAVIGGLGVAGLSVLDSAIPGDQSAITGAAGAVAGLAVLGQAVNTGMTMVDEMQPKKKRKRSNAVLRKLW